MPLTYTPAYLAEKILTSRSALEGERKQVTVLFVDLKGSMELLADRDPEEARQPLDPVLEQMMAAVHGYEGTVNQVMGDGIMALFGAPTPRFSTYHRTFRDPRQMFRVIGKRLDRGMSLPAGRSETRVSSWGLARNLDRAGLGVIVGGV
ncbi:MAG TPA: adenylate/guanylate cyclase domain-containing protein [Candidatus Tectomicrobia bacterium]